MKEAAETDNPDIDETEAESRTDFEWQRRFAHALHGYAASVKTAFAALQQVHELLEENGADEVSDVAPVARALLRGCKEAHNCARDVDEAVRSLIDAHCSTLDVCANALAESDRATAKVRWYTSKVEALEVSPVAAEKSAAKLTRNRAKLREASDIERVLRIRATDSLNSCTLRRDNLCQIATQVVTGTVKALSLSLAHVPDQDHRSRTSSKMNGRNPFDDGGLILDTDLCSVSTSSPPHDCLAPLRSPPQPKWTKQLSPDNGSGSNTTGTPGDSDDQNLTPDTGDSDDPGSNPFEEHEKLALALELLCPKSPPPLHCRVRPTTSCLSWCRTRS
jgi:hypothetical protein